MGIWCDKLAHQIPVYGYADWISARDVVTMATLNGARNNLVGHELGSLEVGKKADVILLKRPHWGFIPFNHPI